MLLTSAKSCSAYRVNGIPWAEDDSNQPEKFTPREKDVLQSTASGLSLYAELSVVLQVINIPIIIKIGKTFFFIFSLLFCYLYIHIIYPTVVKSRYGRKNMTRTYCNPVVFRFLHRVTEKTPVITPVRYGPDTGGWNE
jgi:hypothetical protein